MRFVCLAHVRTSPAIAAAEIITSAYSAVLWPASERSVRCSSENSTLESNCNTFDLPGRQARVMRVVGRGEASTGKAGGSAGDAGDNRGHNRQQREGGQDAAHERETEANRHRSSAGLGPAPEVGTELGGEARERGRGRRTEPSAR